LVNSRQFPVQRKEFPIKSTEIPGYCANYFGQPMEISDKSEIKRMKFAVISPVIREFRRRQGGWRLSGACPKAGGPRYLRRFAVERTISTDTTAVGGNATLLSLHRDG
jgi:hypothetical protein